MTQTELDDLIGTFSKIAEGSIDEKGIYPLPMVAMRLDGTLEIAALAIASVEAVHMMLKRIAYKRDVNAIMLGLDRTTKLGQGTEFSDVLTCFLWDKKRDWPESETGAWREWFQYGVINYQIDPRIVRPMDWANEFWKGKLAEEVDNIRLNRRSTGREL